MFEIQKSALQPWIRYIRAQVDCADEIIDEEQHPIHSTRQITSMFSIKPVTPTQPITALLITHHTLAQCPLHHEEQLVQVQQEQSVQFYAAASAQKMAVGYGLFPGSTAEPLVRLFPTNPRTSSDLLYLYCTHQDICCSAEYEAAQ